jgi:SPX domain protein involved in polyphosphate accumulation
MSFQHKVMASRFELKYLITEEMALRVRDFVQQHLEIDPYGAGKKDLSYPVHSLYLDSDNWEIYWRTINGDKNRFKLRIRYYSESPKVPIFFEIKRRMKDVILKQRCGIRPPYVQSVLCGQLPKPEEMLSPDDPEEGASIHRFIELMMSVNAKPKLHVAYDREAYVHPTNDECRVTMDRNVRCVTRFDGRITTTMENPFVCTQNVVILELKFTERFPTWYAELVRTFNCFQSGAAKYVEGQMMYAGRMLPAKDVVRNLVL